MDLDRLKRRICLLLCLSLSASGTGLPALAATRAASAQVAKASVGDDELRDKLKDVVERAEQVDPSESTETFQETLDQAKGVLADPTASADEIDAVYQALTRVLKPTQNTPEETVSLSVRFHKSVRLSVDGEDQEAANDAGLYQVEMGPEDSFHFTFTPAVEGLEFTQILANRLILRFSDPTSFTYTGTINESAKDILFEFEFVSKAVLHRAMEIAEQLKESPEYDRTAPTKQSSFNRALESAQKICSSSKPTQKDIDQAQHDLIVVINYLQFNEEDKRPLECILDISSQFAEELFTKSTWQNFEQARDDAQAVYDDPDALYDDIDEAYSTLSNVIYYLKYKADFYNLDQILPEAKTYFENIDKYVQAGKQEFIAAYQEAKRVRADEEATQSQVDSAVSRLTQTMQNLQKKIDKAALRALTNDVKSWGLDKYTASSAMRLQMALASAQSILNNPNATQQEVDNTYALLEDAVNRLVEKSGMGSSSAGWGVWGEETLEAAIVYADVLRKSDAYAGADDSARSDLDEAYAGAQALIKQGGMTMETAVQAANDLLVAFCDIKPDHGDREFLTALRQSADLIGQSLYSASTKELNDALVASRELLDRQDAAQDEVDRAIMELSDAVAGLTLKAADRRSLDLTLDFVNNLFDSKEYQEINSNYKRSIEWECEAARRIQAQADADQIVLDAARNELLYRWYKLPSRSDAFQTTFLRALVTVSDVVNINLYVEGQKWFEKSLLTAQKVLESQNAYDQIHSIHGLISSLRALRLAPSTQIADKTALYSLLADTKEWSSGEEYQRAIPAVQTIFDEAYKAAQEAEAQKEITQKQVDTALMNLLSSARLLMYPSDGGREFGPIVLKTARAFNLTRYSDSSVMYFTQALYNFEETLADEEELFPTGDMEDLLDCMEYLGPEEDEIYLLKQLVSQVQEMDLSGFEEEDVVTLRNKLFKATAVANNPNAAMEQMEDAYFSLKDALYQLETPFKDRTDRSFLQASLLKQNDYTPESWSVFQNAYTHAKEVWGNPESSYQERNESLSQLKLSINALVSTADKSSLKAVLDITDQVLEWMQASPGSLDPEKFKVTVSQAKKVYDQPDSTQESVDALRDRVLNRICMVEVPSDQQTLDLLLGLMGPLQEDAYTPASWAVFSQAREGAQNADDSGREAALSGLLAAFYELAYNTDKAELQALVDEVHSYHLGSYEGYEVSLLIDALQVAENALDDPMATQSNIDYYILDLLDYKEMLRVDPSKLCLAVAIEQAKAYQRGAYSSETWKEFAQALEEAQTCYDEPDGNGWDHVDTLNQSVFNLKVDPFRHVLMQLLDAAEAIDPSEYLPDGLKNLKESISDVKYVLSMDWADISELKAVQDRLLTSMGALQAVSDKTELSALIQQAEEYKQEDYASSTWPAFAEALDAAKAVQGNPNATQSMVQEARVNLSIAILNLKRLPDKTQLEMILTKAEEIQTSLDQYIDDGKDEFLSALEWAKSLYADESATIQEISRATRDLMNAIDKLQKPGDKANLLALLNACAPLQEVNFAPKSWAAFQAVLTSAQEVYDNSNATQEMVDDAFDQLDAAISDLVRKADKSKLSALIEYAESLDAENYTSSSWGVFVQALNTAKAVQNNPDATQKMVDDVVQTLNRSMDNLKQRVDKSALLSLISVSSILREADYTANSWNTFKTALDQANTVHSNANATQEEVSKATAGLQNAIKGLQNRPASVDKSVLLSLISVSSILREADYTANSWNAFKTVLDTANTVHGNASATQEEVSKAVSDLQNAIKGLQNRPAAIDKSALLSLISVSSILREADYTADSWNAFKTALDTANNMHGDPNATQSEVSKTVTDLQNAIKGLQNRPAAVDKSALLSLISVSSILREADYTADSWNAFKMDLDTANNVHGDPNATQEEVSKAVTDLQNVIKGLQNRPASVDKSALLRIISTVESLHAENYTEASWKSLDTALTAARAVLSNSAATQDMIDASLDQLQAAVGALEQFVDKAYLLDVIHQAEKLLEWEYTPASWAAFAQALQAAKVVQSDAGATQAAVNHALKNLQSAIASLAMRPNKSVLIQQINRSESLHEADYTVASWSLFSKALQAAKEAADRADVTQDSVDKALQDLLDATNALVKRPNRTPLERQILRAEELDETQYTKLSWNALVKALNEAKTVMDQPEITQEELNTAADHLSNAIDALEVLPRTEFLEREIERAEALDETKYSVENWKTFKLAIEAAKAILKNSDATQDMVDEAEQMLRNARTRLDDQNTRELLAKNIALAESILAKKESYTSGSWKKFTDALEVAKSVSKKEDATTEEIRKASSTLHNNYTDLTPRGDKAELQALLAKSNSLVASDYDPESKGWKFLLKSMEGAKQVNGDVDANTYQVNEAANNLANAITSLIPLPVTERKTNLKALLDDANRLKQSNYKPETWQPFSLARSVAQDIYDNSNLRSEFDDAYAYLNRTKGGLKEISSGGGGGHGGGGGGGGSTGGEGTAAVTTGTTAPVTVPQGSFVSSLTGTVSLTLGTAQQFTVTSATAPVMTQGNGKVAQLHVVKPFDGKSMTLQVYGIGHPGEGTGIYANGQLLFTISLAKAPFVCDTTVDVKVGQNQPYWFTVTPDSADQVPSMTVGNGSVLQTAAGKKVKNANGTTTYYFAVKGIGKPGEGTGVFISLNGVQYKLFNCGIQ